MKNTKTIISAIIVCVVTFWSNLLFGQNYWLAGSNPPCPNPDCVDASNNILGTPTGVDLRISTNGGTERMRITSPGLVGIGTITPLSLLHLNTTANGNLFRTDGPAGSLNL